MFSKLQISQVEEGPPGPLIPGVSLPHPLLQVRTPAYPLRALEPQGSHSSLKLGDIEAKANYPVLQMRDRMGAGKASVKATKTALEARSSPTALCTHGRKNICPVNSLKMSLSKGSWY